MNTGVLVSSLAPVAVILIIALAMNLPGILQKRGEAKVRIEEQRTEQARELTRQKELDLETARLATQPRRTGPIDV